MMPLHRHAAAALRFAAAVAAGLVGIVLCFALFAVLGIAVAGNFGSFAAAAYLVAVVFFLVFAIDFCLRLAEGNRRP